MAGDLRALAVARNLKEIVRLLCQWDRKMIASISRIAQFCPSICLVWEAQLNRAWGSLDGDGNADAIIASQREARRALAYAVLWNFALVAGFALWYSLTTSAVALALELIAVAWLTISGVRLHLHQMNTMVMVAEARIRLLEQQIDDVRMDSVSQKRSTF